MHLAGGLPWALPVCLAVDAAPTRRPRRARRRGRNARSPCSTSRRSTTTTSEHEAEKCFRTTEDAHPGVARLYAQGRHVPRPARSPCSSATSRRSRARTATRPRPARAFAERGWKRVVGFQTRNPIHRAHEYLTKCALETVDGLLHPPARRRDEVRRRPGRGARRVLRGAPRGLLPGRPRRRLGVPGRDALRRPARGDLARDLPQELRLLALHRRPRPRRRRAVLRHLRRAADLRRVRAARARRRADVLRALVLLQGVRPDGVAEDLPARAATTTCSCRGRRCARCSRTASVRRRSSRGPRSPTC